MPPPELQAVMTVESRYENIELVQTVVGELLAERGLDEDARHWVGLAIREALANAIRHGNDSDPQKRVEVEVAFDGAELVISIRDQGPGFDPDAVEDPLAPENLLKPSGRGIYYMRNLMDSVDYTFDDEGGTLVTLRKRITFEEALEA